MGAKPPVNIDADSVDVLPILPSMNFDQTKDFYVNHMGFEEVQAHCEDYCVFRRGRMELWFWLCQNHEIAANSSVMIRASNAVELFEEYTQRGVASSMRDVCEESGVTSFHVRDPHGNLLLFRSPVTSAVLRAA